MSAAEERFVAGDGPLAALIRAQPAFEAPPRLLEHILAALDAAPTPAGFEAPAGLFDTVMAEATRIDTAQAPRRDALLAELAAGKSAADALGAPVSPATAAWLASQQQPTAASPQPRRRRWPWLAGLSTALTAALAVSVALRVVQEPAAPPPMPVEMSAPAESRKDTSAASEASSAGITNDAIAVAAKPQFAERKAETEAAPTQAARARQSESMAREAKRATPRPATPAAVLADAAPAKPAAPPADTEHMSAAAPAESMVAPPPPAAAPPMMAKALRSAPLHAEADEAAAPPGVLIDVALTTAPAELAARLQALPAATWTLTVAAADEAAGKTLLTALTAELHRLGREDTVDMRIGPVAAGRVRITPAP